MSVLQGQYLFAWLERSWRDENTCKYESLIFYRSNVKANVKVFATDRHDKTYIPRITDFGGIKTPSAVVEWFIISLRDERVKRHL